MKLGEILLIFKEFVGNKFQFNGAIWYQISIEITTQTTHFHHQYGAVSLSRAELTAFSSFCTQQISLKVSQLQPPLNERQRLDYEHTGCTWWSISLHACPSALTNCWNVLMWWHYRPAPPPPAPAPPSGLAAPDSTTNITTGTMYIHCKEKKGVTHD